ncbi:uncharacterized membrane protein YvlD (DUF360 family) [Catenulispora sp. EB89]|uniref:hypothetical protein n=1 Tax=Catenulispora sp. EB89 TaxID=3156257 RepID=UPI0035123884
MGWIVLIIVLALVFGVLGAVIKGLLWLLVVGIVLFVAGLLFGAVKSRSGSRTR